ncbi:hypothetical protein GmHk_01G000867 [Glycine max]|nr:hypothetical protein GmHk_01G000867 [Glycine max]
MGQPKFEQKLSQASPNFHAFLILKPKFGFLAMNSYVIGAFHRALGGRMFRHKLQENGGNVACPIPSECIIGLRPSHTNL